jgi:hypothetical protein
MPQIVRASSVRQLKAVRRSLMWKRRKIKTRMIKGGRIKQSAEG